MMAVFGFWDRWCAKSLYAVLSAAARSLRLRGGDRPALVSVFQLMKYSGMFKLSLVRCPRHENGLFATSIDQYVLFRAAFRTLVDWANLSFVMGGTL